MTPIQATKPAIFSLPVSKWLQAIAFCLILSLIGLQLLPMLAVAFAWLYNMWRKNRYFCLVETILLAGGFGFMSPTVLPVRVSDICLIIGIIMLFIYRKSPDVRKITIAMLVYFAILFLFAWLSYESMKIQLFTIRNYMTIIAFFIPLLLFTKHEFEWPKFMEAFTAHVLVICAFYVIDAYVIGGFMLLPATHTLDRTITIFDPYYSSYSERHYPPGLFLLIPLVPAINYNQLRLSLPQYILIILALMSSRTNSLLFALITCWVFFRPQIGVILKYILTAIILVASLYYLDLQTGEKMRVAYNIDQFVALQVAQDEEDLAAFGTGRMAQIIPKWILLSDMGRLHIGFGFLHRKKTTDPRFIIKNEFYTDISQSEEVATGVEVTQVQTILDIGYLGLIAQTFFYVGIYFIIRHMRYSRYYLATLVGVSVLGIGGFAGLNSIHGLLILSLILGAILCANRQVQPFAPKPQPTRLLLTE